jgi:hypothetical protein
VARAAWPARYPRLDARTWQSVTAMLILVVGFRHRKEGLGTLGTLPCRLGRVAEVIAHPHERREGIFR